MENQNKKIGFFSRVKIAVTQLENYGIFLEEKSSIAIKYFFLIVLCLAFVIALVETYTVMQIVSKGYEYMKNELPDFLYTDGNLKFEKEVKAYDEEYDFYMITDTTDEISQEKLQEYKSSIKSMGMIFLKDKVIYKAGGSEAEYHYRDFVEEYGFENLDRGKLLQEIDKIGLIGIAVALFMMLMFSVYIFQVVNTFMDWMIMYIFTFVTARICRISMQMRHAWNISIYTLTLSIILSMVYYIAYYLTDFYTEYFRVVYLLIAYVYVVAVILMIKSDLIRQQIEVAKIVEMQKQMQKETEERKQENPDKPEKKKNKKEEENREDTIDEEPDGSEI